MRGTLAIFDWNGGLLEELKQDELKFGIDITYLPGGVMGFHRFELAGPEKAIRTFLNYYELELETVQPATPCNIH